MAGCLPCALALQARAPMFKYPLQICAQRHGPTSSYGNASRGDQGCCATVLANRAPAIVRWTGSSGNGSARSANCTMRYSGFTTGAPGTCLKLPGVCDTCAVGAEGEERGANALSGGVRDWFDWWGGNSSRGFSPRVLYLALGLRILWADESKGWKATR